MRPQLAQLWGTLWEEHGPALPPPQGQVGSVLLWLTLRLPCV